MVRKLEEYRQEPVGTLGIACCATGGCFCIDRKKRRLKGLKLSLQAFELSGE